MLIPDKSQIVRKTKPARKTVDKMLASQWQQMDKRAEVLEAVKQWETNSQYIVDIQERRKTRGETFVDDIFKANYSSIVV